MTKATTPALDPAPTYIVAGSLPADIAANLRVVDAASGDVIGGVIEADATAGKVTRYASDQNGDLVRDGDRFKTVAEDRAVRIEWVEPPLAPVDEEAAPAA